MRKSSPIRMFLHKSVALCYWYLRHHWYFRRRLMKECRLRSVRPFRRFSWHLGSRYYECEDRDGHRIFVKVSTHQPMIANEVAARHALLSMSAGPVSTPTLHYFDVEGKLPFVAMSWVDGRTLDDVLVSNPQGIPHAIASGLVHLVDELHKAGIVHRDITPRNLLIPHRPTFGERTLLLIDFAFAIVGNATDCDRDWKIPDRAFHTLGDGLNPAPLVWDDAVSCLKILEKLERLSGRDFPAVRSELQSRIGRRVYRMGQSVCAVEIA